MARNTTRCKMQKSWTLLLAGVLTVLWNALLAFRIPKPSSNEVHHLVKQQFIGQKQRSRSLPMNAPCVKLDCIRTMGNSMAKVFEDRSNQTWKISSSKSADTGFKHYGLLYVKVPKTGSSTAAAVALRIAHKHGVQVKAGHALPLEEQYQNRHPTHSFLWASVREPSDRAMSFLSYEASKASAASFSKEKEGRLVYDELNVVHQLKSMDHMGTVVQSRGRGGTQLALLSLKFIPQHSAWKPTFPSYVVNSQRVEIYVRNVLESYDFLLVTDRLEESLVALALSLGLDLGDVLVSSSKVASSGQYLPVHLHRNNRNVSMVCVPLLKIPTTPAIQSYLDSDEWHAMNYGDYLLYAAASASLNLTIQSLGKEKFRHALARYQQLLAQAYLECNREMQQGPCSPKGELQLQDASQNCYQDYLGCGYPCIDRMVAKIRVPR